MKEAAADADTGHHVGQVGVAALDGSCGKELDDRSSVGRWSLMRWLMGLAILLTLSARRLRRRAGPRVIGFDGRM